MGRDLPPLLAPTHHLPDEVSSHIRTDKPAGGLACMDLKFLPILQRQLSPKSIWQCGLAIDTRYWGTLVFPEKKQASVLEKNVYREDIETNYLIIDYGEEEKGLNQSGKVSYPEPENTVESGLPRTWPTQG